MKQIFFLLIVIFFTIFMSNVFAQADNCSSATLITVTANCASPTNGTTIGATQNIPGCVGNADDDVWYQFVATSTSHQINVVPSATMDPVVQLFSGACATLTTISCMDATFTGQNEVINATGLTIGLTYRIRVYNYGVGSGSGTFTICVTNPPPAPSNDICSSATNLSINTICSNTVGTTIGATQSLVGCAGTADDDVWYSFTAVNTTATITVNPSVTMDAVMQLYSGSCASLASIQCMDNGFTDGNEVINAVGLTVGSTYFIRVYDYYSGGGGTFDICVTGPSASAIPTNDEPCSAIALPSPNSSCNFLQFSTVNASASIAAPTPASCVGGGAPQQGGFAGTSHDVWFSVVIPANGQITITSQPGYGLNDGVMALYSGACGALTQVACSDDNNYPGTLNDFKPYIAQTGLTPGATYYIRYWGFGTSSGNFGLCVSSATNDFCSTSLYICDLNGYSASTSAAYTPDRPCNMYGNNEDTITGVNQVDGVNTGGIFGQAGPWGSGAPLFDVNINNNSWIKFTASNTTAILNVAIGNCWVGSYPSGGIQMQIFASNGGCCNFVPVSNFQENSSGFTITANNLTIGNDYYLMVDGYAGDICSYTISANAGVQFPDITTTKPILCYGDNTLLVGPIGASSYEWLPTGETTPNITVAPSTTTTYTLIVSGVCGNKQTLTKTIVVNPPPTTSNAGIAQNTCLTTATLSGNAPVIGTGFWTLTSGTGLITTPTSPTSGVTGLAVGANIFTWTISNSPCTASTSTITITVAPTNTVTPASVSPSLCINTLMTNITHTTTGATGIGVTTGLPVGVTASWAGNVITITGTPTASGTYNYSIPLTGGCAVVNATGSITITPNNTVTTASSSPTLCINTLMSNITHTTTGATGIGAATGLPSGVVAVWAGNTITISGTPTVSGTFNYSIPLTGGCGVVNAIGSITITPNNTVSVASSSPTLCINTAITNITHTTTGATGIGATIGLPAGVTASWSGGTITITGSPTASGTFNYSIPLTGGCGVVSAIGTITVNATDNASFTYSGITYCLTGANPTPISVTLPGGVFSISGVGVINSNTGQINLAASGIGTYSVTYNTTILGNPCPSLTTTTITITSAPSAAFSYDAPIYCQNVTAPIISFGAGASGGFFSSTPVGLSLTSISGVIDLSTSVAGTYTVYNNIPASGGCATALDSTTITVNPNAIITLSSLIGTNVQSLCVNNTITTISYTISGGGTGAGVTGLPIGVSGLFSGGVFTITGIPTSTGTFNYIVTTTGTCGQVSENGTLIVTPNNTVTAASSSPTLCINTTITNITHSTTGATGIGVVIGLPSGIITVWAGNTITISGTPTTSGTFNYSIPLTGGCGTVNATGTITVTLNNTVTPASSSPTLCIGTLLTNITHTTTGATGIGVATGLPVGVTASWVGNTITLSGTPTTSGTFNYIIPLTGGCGAVNATGTIIINSLPTVAIIGNNIICNGESTVLAASGGIGYNWNTGSIIDSIIVNPILDSTYTVTVTDANSCSNTSSITVTVKALPVMNITGASSLCNGQTATLTASNASSYVWNTSAVTPSINVSPTVNPTNYQVVGTGANGCKDSAQFVINVIPKPVAAITGSSNVCFGDFLALSATGGSTYIWNTGDSTSNINVAPTDTIVYTVIVTSNGCSDTASTTINIIPLPTISAYADTTIILGQSAVLTAISNTPFTWSPNEALSCTNCTSVTVNPKETTNYCVTTTQNGCPNISCVTVVVDNICGSLFVPNAFTPNGDGSNDCIMVYNNCLQEVLFRVYSRWGAMLFESEEINGCWDGTYNGSEMNTGVYAFTVKAKLINGEEVELKGNVSLFR